MGTITNKANNANTKLVDTLEMTDNASLDTYADGSIVKGEAVINAIKNVKSIGGNIKMEIQVKTKASSDYVKYGYVDGSNSITAYSQSDSTKDDYINPSASFECTQVPNANGVVTKIQFEQK